MDEHEHFSFVKYLIIAVVLIVILLGITYLFSVWRVTDSLINTNTTNHSEIIAPESKDGRVYLSLVKLKKNKNDEFLNSYVYDVAENILTESNPDELGGLEVYHSFSADKSKVAFLGIPVTQKNTGSIVEADIYIASITREVDFPQFINSRNVTENSNLFVKQQLSINNNGEVLFVAKDNRDVSDKLSSVDDWGVYITGDDFGIRHLTNGTQPKWINNNQFIYVAKNGISVYNLKTKKSTVIAKFYGIKEAKNNIKLDLSDDKKIIVWTNPDMWRATIIRAKSWDNFEFTELGSMRVQGFWPVLSPGNTVKRPTFILQKADFTSRTGGNPPTSLGFFDLRTFKEDLKSEVSLSDYYSRAMFVTDWR